MNLATRRKRLRQDELWCNLEISGGGFVSLFVALLMIVMADVALPKCHMCRNVVDLPKTDSPVLMRGAAREDALVVAVQRDGTLYLGMNKVTARTLPELLQRGVQGGAERQVYVSADARAKVGAVAEVIDAVRDAGIDRVGFLTEKRKDISEQ